MLNSIIPIFDGATAAATSFDSIATVTVGAGGASSITFSSIPSTYKHLQIRGIARNTTAGSGIEISKVNFNDDTGNNYARHRVGGNGSTASATATTTTSAFWFCAMFCDGELANSYGSGVLDILDYADTNKYKTARSLEGLDSNGGGEISLRSGLWQNTNAITKIVLTPTANNFKQYTTFALYGVKG